jgi:hypothetical protein
MPCGKPWMPRGWPQYELTAPLPYQTAEKENEFLEEAAIDVLYGNLAKFGGCMSVRS